MEIKMLTLSVLGLMTFGLFLDRFIPAERMRVWRSLLLKTWEDMNQGKDGLFTSVNYSFLELFEKIYGHKALSLKRVIASIITSLLGITVFLTIFSEDNVLLYSWKKIWEGMVIMLSPAAAWDWESARELVVAEGLGDWLSASLLLVLPILINLIADYVSYLETHLVLSINTKVKYRVPLWALVILDFVLTAIIFSAVFIASFVAFMYFATQLVVEMGINVPDLIELMLGAMVDPEMGLPFFLSTFVTSLIWYVYLLTFSVVLVAMKLTPLTSYFLHVAIQSKRPGTVFMSVTSLLVITTSVFITFLSS